MLIDVNVKGKKKERDFKNITQEKYVKDFRKSKDFLNITQDT